MSSILKALKKLEDERNGKVRYKAVAIESAIVNESRNIILNKRPLLLILFSAIILVAAGAAFSFLLFSSVVKNANKSEARKQSSESAVRIRLPPKTDPETAPLKIMQISDSKHQTGTERKTYRTAITGKPEVEQQEKVKTEKPVRPVLALNGIAFRTGETASNIAIINGRSVGVGEIIEGAVVEDIQKDRVRLSFSGEKLELIIQR